MTSGLASGDVKNGGDGSRIAGRGSGAPITRRDRIERGIGDRATITARGGATDDATDDPAVR